MFRHRSFVLVTALSAITLGLTSGCPPTVSFEDECLGITCDEFHYCAGGFCFPRCQDGSIPDQNTGDCGPTPQPGDPVAGRPCSSACEFCHIGTPEENNCPQSWNGTNDGCDCGCQFTDPDCNGGSGGDDPCAVLICDDGNACTDDACIDGECLHVDNRAVCDDADSCTENDECRRGICAGVATQAAIDCVDDGLFCNGSEACDPTTGDCTSSGDPCDARTETCNETDDLCDPVAPGPAVTVSGCPATANQGGAATLMATTFGFTAGGTMTVAWTSSGASFDPADSFDTTATLTGSGLITLTGTATNTVTDDVGTPFDTSDDITTTETASGSCTIDVISGGFCYTPGQAVTRTVPINPPSGTLVYGVEDTPPPGWTVSDISNDGAYDAGSNAVKWFFLDDDSRTLTYTTSPANEAAGIQCFNGLVNYDGGTSLAVEGDPCIDSCDE